MGFFYQIKCKECGKAENFYLGLGYLPLEETAYAEIMKRAEYKDLRTSVHGPEDLYDSYYKLYYCKECKTVERHIYFKVRNMTSFRIRHKCRKCKRVMVGMDDFDKFYTKEILLNCRKCGAEDIFDPEGMIPGFWD